MRIDFSKISNENLIRHYHFHEMDTRCMTEAEECRRMYLLQEYGAEMQRRGIDYWGGSYDEDFDSADDRAWDDRSSYMSEIA